MIDESVGYVVKRNCVDEAIDKIVYYCNNKIPYSAFEIVRANFDMNKCFLKYLKLYGVLEDEFGK